jgi:hypothetical protein
LTIILQSRLATYANHRQSLPANSFSSPMAGYRDTSASDARLPDAPVQESWIPRLRQPSQSSHTRGAPTDLRSVTSDKSSAAPHASIDTNKARTLGLNSRTSFSTPSTPRGASQHHLEASPELPSHIPHVRSPSSASTSIGRPSYRPSHLANQYSRTYNSSPLLDHHISNLDHIVASPIPAAASRIDRADGTESTTSTNAPSTVWDELDDLKSRIKKLELTGKMPSSSGQAISNVFGDRPRTATTTVTTLSASPKNGNRRESPTESTVAGPGTSNVHPLLHSALAKSKPLLESDVYKALEASAADAISLAAMMGSTGQPGVINSTQSVIGYGGAGISDRQVRRKVDSMCRSLTELCIALSEGKAEPIGQPIDDVQGGSPIRDASPEYRPAESVVDRNPYRQFRGISRDRDTQSGVDTQVSTPRMLSRLEQRRSSLANYSSGTSPQSPRMLPESGTPTNLSQSTQSRLNALNRPSTVLLRNRGATDANEDTQEDASFRAPSRAATEVGRVTGSPREYTSSHPLPSRANTLSTRRHLATQSISSALPTQTTPKTPTSNTTRRYLDRSSPAAYDQNREEAGSISGKLAADRHERLGSLTGTAGTTITPRMRTGSLDHSPSLVLQRKLRQTQTEAQATPEMGQ